MPPVLQNILAFFGGLTAGSGVNMALIELNTRVLFPMPAGLDPNDLPQLQLYIDSLPLAGFLVVIAAHLGQAFVGAWVAARLAASRPMGLALIIGGLSLAGGVGAMMMIEGPAWMLIELPLYLVCAWLAGRLELARRASKLGG